MSKVNKGSLLRSTMIASAMVFGGTAAMIFAPAASAQDYTSGGIVGQILMPDGSPASGVVVTLRSDERGFMRSATTDVTGGYRFNRLPIGEYNLTASSGARSIERTVAVTVGSVTEGTSYLAGDDDEIIVTGQKVAVDDFTINQIGLTVDVSEVFDTQPLARNLTSVALLAPGTTSGDTAFGNLPSIGGSSVGENAFYINGFNTTDFRNFVGGANIPFELYDQVEVKSGGYSAEFGRSTGGVLNAVTKSGSNDFHFGVNAYAEPDSLRAPVKGDSNGQSTFGFNELDKRDDFEGNIWASGPIIKDRLFFFGLYNAEHYEFDNYTASETRDTGQIETTRINEPFYAGKLDLVITDDHLLEYTYIHNESNEETILSDVTYDAQKNITSQTPIPGSGNDFSGGDINILQYTGNFGQNFTLSVLYGEQTNAQTVNSSADSLPVIYDNRGIAGNPAFPGGWINFTNEAGDDKRELFRVDADYYLDNFVGDHHFRIGMDQETLTANNTQQYSGGIYYRYYNPTVCDNFAATADSPTVHTSGSDCVRIRRLFSGGEFETIQTAFYIQDAWEVTDALTLNLGIRNETFDNKNANGETFTKIENQIATRLGFGYDVADNTQLFGSYGRYYLPVATNTNIRLAGAEDYNQEFYDMNSALNGDFTPTITSGLWDRTVFGTGEVGETQTVVNENLDPMFQDEFILGLRHAVDAPGRFVDGWDLGAAFTHRVLSSTLEDVAIDAAVLDWCDSEGYTGCEDIWTGFHQYVLTNPGSDMVVYTSSDEGDALTGVAGTGPLRMDLSAADLGYPEAERTYTALELTADKMFDWGGINANYTLSRSEGNYEGSVKSDNGQDDAGLTQDFDQPGLVDGSDGLLPNHRAHKFKVRGYYEFNDEFLVGGNFTLTSPRQFGCLGLHPTDVFAQAYGNDSRYCAGELVQRGSVTESDWIRNLDMNFVVTPDIVETGKLSLRLDLFNVLNFQGVTDVQEYGEDDSATALTSYGLPTGYQSPFRARLGVSYEY